MDIEVYRVQVNKELLALMAEDERKLFIVFGHLLNEINVFGKLLLWTSSWPKEDDTLSKAGISQGLSVSKVFAGKLYEVWQVVRKSYLNKKCSKSHNEKLKEDARQALGDLKKYFGKTNALMKVRNEYAFHYDSAAMAKAFFEIPDSEDWAIYLSKLNSNSLYWVSEAVVNYGMLVALDKKDIALAFGDLVDELLRVWRLLVKFLSGFLISLVDEYEVLSEDYEAITVQGPELLDVVIPYFTYLKDSSGKGW